MSERYGIKAYWGHRPESAEECARRAETFFYLLARCHPDFARWYEKGHSAREALQLGFEPTREAFQRFFGQEKYQLVDDGFTFGAWSGHLEQGQGAVVTLSCGSTAGSSPNFVWLSLPRETLGHERLVKAPIVSGAMRAMAMAWEPEWAVATTDELWKELSGGSQLGCFVGWMTYLARERGDVPALPAPVCVEQAGDTGEIITLTPERLLPGDPEHIALAWRIQRALEERGLLRPMVQPTVGR